MLQMDRRAGDAQPQCRAGMTCNADGNQILCRIIPRSVSCAVRCPTWRFTTKNFAATSSQLSADEVWSYDTQKLS